MIEYEADAENFKIKLMMLMRIVWTKAKKNQTLFRLKKIISNLDLSMISKIERVRSRMRWLKKETRRRRKEIFFRDDQELNERLNNRIIQQWHWRKTINMDPIARNRYSVRHRRKLDFAQAFNKKRTSFLSSHSTHKTNHWKNRFNVINAMNFDWNNVRIPCWFIEFFSILWNMNEVHLKWINSSLPAVIWAVEKDSNQIFDDLFLQFFEKSSQHRRIDCVLITNVDFQVKYWTKRKSSSLVFQKKIICWIERTSRTRETER